MTLSVTKSIQFARPAAAAYAFLSDPANLPQWAIHNVTSITPIGDGRWEMDTPRGKGRLIPHSHQATGVVDHDFIDGGEGVWSVSARVAPVGPSESVYVITLTKPDGMSADLFEQGMRLMDDELAALKACIERV